MAPVVVADSAMVFIKEVLRASAKSCLANIPCTGLVLGLVEGFSLLHLSIK